MNLDRNRARRATTCLGKRRGRAALERHSRGLLPAYHRAHVDDPIPCWSISVRSVYSRRSRPCAAAISPDGHPPAAPERYRWPRRWLPPDSVDFVERALRSLPANTRRAVHGSSLGILDAVAQETDGALCSAHNLDLGLARLTRRNATPLWTFRDIPIDRVTYHRHAGGRSISCAPGGFDGEMRGGLLVASEDD